MSHHSGLDAKDGIIIGASSVGHLEENLRDLKKGPLPEEMVKAFDEAWEHVRICCPSYFKDEASAKEIATFFKDGAAAKEIASANSKK